MEYITTKARLEEVSVATLGPMTDRSYAEFVECAYLTGLVAPKLMLTWVYKREAPLVPAGSEVVYPIKEAEWPYFLADIPTYCVDTPLVYVVDGMRYTAMI